jgi:hypothetical protein
LAGHSGLILRWDPVQDRIGKNGIPWLGQREAASIGDLKGEGREIPLGLRHHGSITIHADHRCAAIGDRLGQLP